MFAESLYGALSRGLGITKAYMQARNRLANDADRRD